MWLAASSTNKDPKVVANFYCSCVKEMGFCPTNLWTDAGTENVRVAAIHSALTQRADSHCYVTSVHNQRIEAWWSYLIKARGNWWREFFHDMCSADIYNPAHNFQRNCLQYCFMRFIEADLQQAAALWNSHRIRPSRGTVCPAGIPDELFFLPSNSGAEHYGIPMNVAALEDMRHDACRPAPQCDSDDIAQYLDYVMQQLGEQVDLLQTADDCVGLYLRLLDISQET